MFELRLGIFIKTCLPIRHAIYDFQRRLCKHGKRDYMNGL